MPSSKLLTPSYYKRILLKLSGEILSTETSSLLQLTACQDIAKSIKSIHETGIDLAIVIGGGNIFRGSELKSLHVNQTAADMTGMLATLINGTILQDFLKQIGCPSKILSALDCPKIAESYSLNATEKAFSSKEVIIFVGGTGNPYFTTDTAAALRASEIKADILIKATKVDGVYSKDPLKYREALIYKTVTYSQMLREKLEIMDATAVTLCQSNKIPIRVINMKKLKENPIEFLGETNLGTLINSD